LLVNFYLYSITRVLKLIDSLLCLTNWLKPLVERTTCLNTDRTTTTGSGWYQFYKLNGWMEIRRHTETGLHVKSTRWISASDTRTKHSTAEIVTQSTTTFARKVPSAYFFAYLLQGCLSYWPDSEFLKSGLHVHLGLAEFNLYLRKLTERRSIAPSRVNQKIFAVLVDHIVLASFKLVSFYIYICFFTTSLT